MEYHLAEYEIALDPSRPEHLMPPFGPHHRRVLDVGCGAGQTLAAAEVLHPLEGRVSCGVDIDADALAAGRARWPGLGLAVARGEELPFADGAFDLVCLRVSLPYMRVQDAMRECGRVLTPGGEVWLALHGWRGAVRDLAAAVRRRSVRATAFRAYVLANGLVLQATGSTVAFPVGRRPTESWQGARGIQLALRRAGFADVRVHATPRGGQVAVARRA